MKSELSIIFLVLGNIVAVTSAIVSIWSVQRKLRARHSLVARLARDLAFVRELERLNRMEEGDAEYIAELGRIQTIIAERLKELGDPEVKLLEQPMQQRSRTGRTRFVEGIAKDVQLRFEHAA